MPEDGEAFTVLIHDQQYTGRNMQGQMLILFYCILYYIEYCVGLIVIKASDYICRMDVVKYGMPFGEIGKNASANCVQYSLPIS